VRAVVVLREGDYVPSPELVRELQDHVKRETAPYKYPRIIDFVEELPEDGQRQGSSGRSCAGSPGSCARSHGQSRRAA